MERFRQHAFDWIALLFFACVPALIFWESATSLAEQGAAEGGPLENAAFYPRLIASLMCLVVLAQLVRLSLGRLQHASPLAASEGTVMALGLTALFLFYLVVLPYAGFHVATPVLLVVMMLTLGVSIVAAIPGTLVLWLSTAYVFEGLLNVVLPVGALNIAIFS